MQHFFRRHLVGNHQQHAVALGARDQGKAETGVAGGGLDHRAAGLESSILFSGFDHCQRDAVLDRAAGVLAFKLDEKPARSSVQTRHFDQRRVSE